MSRPDRSRDWAACGVAERIAKPQAAKTVLLAFLFAPAAFAESTVASLRAQKVGDATYFEVVVRLPNDARLPSAPRLYETMTPQRRRALAEQPRLTPLDASAGAVCCRLPWHEIIVERQATFHGRVLKPGKTEFRLLVPVEPEAKKGDDSLASLLGSPRWVEERLTLDFGKAETVAPPRERRGGVPTQDDLEGRWAEAQARQMAALECQSGEFGFYGLAREALGRKYAVPAPALPGARPAENAADVPRLYEMTTGATALAESLALKRMLARSASSAERRVHPVRDIPGITIAEHPWEKMMAGRKPAPEPLATLTPHDHYYFAFNDMRKYIEFGDLLDEWGSSLLSAYAVQGREYGLQARFEKQLCLRKTALGRTLGPALLRGVAITGSDFYLREGSDLSLIFHVRSRDLFLAAVETFIVQARKEFGDELKQAKAEYRGVTVESFVTPLREVSLHRAAVGDFVIYSNSPVAVRRVLDTHAGRRKALADALDFRYMRTVFRADDRDEDGFVFLSDAFIRRQVGPESKIKEKRRLEALTSLTMVTHGALFAAWESGKLPADLVSLLAESRLRADEITVPEGKGLRWDGERRTAVSEAYNTIRFATPLIELPIEDVTAEEREEYLRFREGYLRNWRQYFDPVGVRLGMKDEQVKAEVYILPLVTNSEYDRMRGLTGGGVLSFDPATLSPRTLLQYTIHLSPNSRDPGGFVFGRQPARPAPFGDQFLIRLNDGPAFKQWAKAVVAREASWPVGSEPSAEEEATFWKTPLLLGVKIGDAKAFDETESGLRALVEMVLMSRDGRFAARPATVRHQGVEITVRGFDPDCEYVKRINPPGTPREKRFVPAIHQAKADGFWYVSLSLDALKDAIDHGRQKPSPKEEMIELNSGLYLAPKAAKEAAAGRRVYLEWKSHRQALDGAGCWYALYRAGVVPADGDAASAARHFLGFVPVSPDGSAYRFDAKAGEVVNTRHGSPREPRLHDDLAADSPVRRLFERVPSLRAELRFREDGIHSVITLRRVPKK